MSTTECSCRLWPSPGMYVMTSMPLLRRTRATLRSAEFGFFGVVVYTRTQTPRFWGHDCSAGDLVFWCLAVRPLRMSWLIVGMKRSASPGNCSRFRRTSEHGPGAGARKDTEDPL